MIGPVQIDRWGPVNLSMIGPDFHSEAPELGVRGEGNSNQITSTLTSPQAIPAGLFVEGEVGRWAAEANNPARGRPVRAGIRRSAPHSGPISASDGFWRTEHAIRVVTSMHPG